MTSCCFLVRLPASAHFPGPDRVPICEHPNPGLSGREDFFYSYGVEPLPDIVPDASYDEGYFGRKVFAVAYNGTVNLHGFYGVDRKSTEESGRASWFKVHREHLPKQADTRIIVQNPAVLNTWPDYAWIALTSTDFLAGHNERLWVKVHKNDSGILELIYPEALQWDHIGVEFTFENATQLLTDTVDLRANVGLLTRSINIQSAGDSPDSELQDGYGGHTMVRQGFRHFQASGVALNQLGQGGRKGRYSMHWHLSRLVENSYFVDGSVWDSNTRVAVIHGTHGALLARVVSFENFGHAIYVEDGTEIRNRIEFNLITLVKGSISNDSFGLNGTSGTPMHYRRNPRGVAGIFSSGKYSPFAPAPNPTAPILSQSDAYAPTGVWIRNPWNYIIGNVVVGTELLGRGYWFVPVSANGPSSSQDWGNTEVQAWLLQTPDAQRNTTYARRRIQNPDIPNGGFPPSLIFDRNEAHATMFHIDTVRETYLSGPLNALPLSKNSYGKVSCAASTNENPNLRTKIQWGLDYPVDSYPVDPVVPGALSATSMFYCDPNATLTTQCKACAVSDNGDNQFCDLLLISRFVASFGYAPINFASIWLRDQFFLFQVTFLLLSSFIS